jgi:hypothetical protein
MMITKDQMFDPLLRACPSFAPTWRSFLNESIEHPKEDPLYYIALGDLATHLVERFRSGDTEEFTRTFRVVERWLCEGDHYVREAAVIGLLEGIQNNAGRSGVESADFERWFLPETRVWWAKLNRFWSGDPSALQKD